MVCSYSRRFYHMASDFFIYGKNFSHAHVILSFTFRNLSLLLLFELFFWLVHSLRKSHKFIYSQWRKIHDFELLKENYFFQETLYVHIIYIQVLKIAATTAGTDNAKNRLKTVTNEARSTTKEAISYNM